jgi:hypothetical protein
MANVQEVSIYDQPTGIGATRLQAVAVLVTNPGEGEAATIGIRYQVQLAAGPPAVVVGLAREDWLAIRLMRNLPTP